MEAWNLFLTALAREGVAFGMRDMRRLRLAFSAERNWDRDAIEGTLIALLAKDPRESEAVKRCFAQLWRTAPERPFREWLELFRVFGLDAQARTPTFEPGSSPQPGAQNTTNGDRRAGPERGGPSDGRSGPPNKAMVGGLLLLLLLFLPLTDQIKMIEKAPPPDLGPQPELVATEFALSADAGDGVTDYIQIRNRGDEADRLRELAFTETADNPFRIIGDHVGTAIPAGGELKIPFLYLSETPGSHERDLRLSCESGWRATIHLAGSARQRTQTSEVQDPILEGFADGPVRHINLQTKAASWPRTWLAPLLAALLAFAALLVYSRHLFHWRRTPKDEPLPLDRESPHFFRFETIGGEPEPLLTEETLDEAAELIGTYLTELPSARLDEPRTVSRTLANGGMPKLHFQHHRASIRLVLLEDPRAARALSTTIPSELKHGLERRGLPITLGRLEPAGDAFVDELGLRTTFRDLEDEAHSVWLLIFSDGACFHAWSPLWRREVARRFQVAFLDQREPRSRLDDGFGFPVFSATAAGLLACLGACYSEAETQAEQESAPVSTSDDPEEHLGDALLWAADCCLIQPCSTTLAQLIRRSHYRHLPPERLQRLTTLPGTALTRAGMFFSQEIFVFLGKIRALRRDPHENEAVRQTLMQALAAAQPKDMEETAPAMRVWQAQRELLELIGAVEYDGETLACLAAGPLQSFIRERLIGYKVARPDDPELPHKVTLPITNQKCLHRLGVIEPELGVRPVDFFPLKRDQKLAWAGMAALVLLLVGFTWTRVQADRAATVWWTLKGVGTEPVQLYAGDTLLGTWGEDWTQQTRIVPGDVRVRVGAGEQAIAASLRLAADQVMEIHLMRDTRLELVRIGAGSFLRGSPQGEPGRDSDETQHRVTLTRDFYLGKSEVTRAQYAAIMGTDALLERKGLTWDMPISDVSYDDALNFCNKLTEREREAGRLPPDWLYTLPTEAQWEYACRAGTQTPFSFGAEITPDQVNYYDKGLGNPLAAGSLPANPWGLHEMHGNVSEWCLDVYGDYLSGQVTDPLGPEAGVRRVIRGGRWDSYAGNCRAAYRVGFDPAFRRENLGFRVALVESAGRQPQASNSQFIKILNPISDQVLGF